MAPLSLAGRVGTTIGGADPALTKDSALPIVYCEMGLIKFLPRLLSRGLSLSRGESYWLSTAGKHTEHHLHPALPVDSTYSQVPTSHPDK